MKILLALYHDCNKEERSMELINCCKRLGHLHLVSYVAPTDCDNEKITCHLVDKSSPIALLHFINLIKKIAKAEKPDIIFLHDSDCSVVIPYIKKILPQSKLVYDSSEFDKPMKNRKKKKRNNGFWIALKGVLTQFRVRSERVYVKYSDLVFAANEERASMMVEYMDLKSKPLVFDNMHKIKDDYDKESCNEKYGNYLKPNKFKVLFAGGIDEERLTFDYVKSFVTLPNKYELIIVGSASPAALMKFKEMIVNNGVENRIHYLGFVTRQELKYLIDNTDASVVVFDKDSYNTLYCASGKFYESLFQGKPILASENPPLKRLCEMYGIGVSNDDYAQGVIELYNNYEYYKSNVCEYVEKLDYDNRIENLANQVMEHLYDEKSI